MNFDSYIGDAVDYVADREGYVLPTREQHAEHELDCEPTSELSVPMPRSSFSSHGAELTRPSFAKASSQASSANTERGRGYNRGGRGGGRGQGYNGQSREPYSARGRGRNDSSSMSQMVNGWVEPRTSEDQTPVHVQAQYVGRGRGRGRPQQNEMCYTRGSGRANS